MNYKEMSKPGMINKIKELQDHISMNEQISDPTLINTDERFRVLFEKSADAIFAEDLEGFVLDVNPAACELSKITRDELIGKNVLELVPEEKRNEIKNDFRKWITGKISFYEGFTLTSEGQKIPVEIHANIIQFAGKKALLMIVRNISKRMKEQKIQKVIYNISNAINTAKNLDELYKIIHNELKSIIYARNFFIALCDDKSDQIITSYHIDKIKTLKAPTMIKTDGLTAYVIKSKKSIFLTEELRDRLVQEGKVRKSDWKSKIWIGVPLKIKDKIIGAIAVQSYKDESAYSRDDMKLLEFVSGQIAFAIDRKRNEEALRVSESRFRELFENLPNVAVQGYDANATIHYWNKANELVYGYTAKEAIGKNLVDLIIPPEMRETVQQIIKHGAETGEMPPAAELNLMRKDGSLVPVFSSHAVIKQPGQDNELFCVDVDLTDRIRIELRLAKLNECFLNFTTDPDENINRIVAVCGELMGATCALYNCLQQHLLYSAGQWNTPPDYNPVDKPEGHICYDVIKRAKDDLLVVRHLQKTAYALSDPNVKPYKLETYVGKAVKFGNTYEGSLCVVYQKDFVPDKKDEWLMGVLASAIAVEEERKHGLRKLQKLLEETINGLISAVEIRDPYTAGHQRRVAKLAVAMAKEMELHQEQIEGIRFASLVHDIGKIYVPAEILSKPGKLTGVEFELIKTHSRASYDVLKKIEFPWPVAEIVLQHHERIDGSGYPKGITGKEMMLEAKIINIADFIEAFSSNRPYRPAFGIDIVLDELTKNKGILFEPEIVDVCLRLFKEKRFEFTEQ